MSASTATEYAQHYAQSIRDAVETGSPFGWYDEETDDYFTDRDDVPRKEAGDFDPEDVDGYDPEDALTAPFLDSIREAWGTMFLADALDLRYVVNADRTYRDAEVCVALGGPNVWIHTATQEVFVSWGFETAREPLPGVFVTALDEAAEELWNEGV